MLESCLQFSWLISPLFGNTIKTNFSQRNTSPWEILFSPEISFSRAIFSFSKAIFFLQSKLYYNNGYISQNEISFQPSVFSHYDENFIFIIWISLNQNWKCHRSFTKFYNFKYMFFDCHTKRYEFEFKNWILSPPPPNSKTGASRI